MLAELVKAERLSEGFCDRLLTWRHSGFSVYGAQVVLPEESGRLAHLARYATRPPLAQQRVQRHDERTYLLRTAPDPQTGATQLALDPLELIHRLTQQIPDPRQHLVRYYGAYANRARHMYRPAAEEKVMPVLALDFPVDVEIPGDVHKGLPIELDSVRVERGRGAGTHCLYFRPWWVGIFVEPAGRNS